MSSKRGLVMELVEDAAVVLTPTGEFLNIKLKKGEPSPVLGQEINIPEKQKLPCIRWSSMAACAALLVFMILSPILYQSVFSLQPVRLVATYYLTVDINPSIELGLDNQNKVISVVALNSDGEKVLSDQDLIGLKDEEAIEIIIEKSVDLGYLISESDEQNVLLTYMTNTAKQSGENQEYVQKVEQILDRKQVKAQVKMVTAPAEVRGKAEEIGLSAGKYMILLEAIDYGLEISDDNLRKDSMKKSIAEVGGNLEQLIEKVGQEKNLKQLEEKVIKKLQDKYLEESRWQIRRKEVEMTERNMANKKPALRKNDDGKTNKSSKTSKEKANDHIKPNLKAELDKFKKLRGNEENTKNQWSRPDENFKNEKIRSNNGTEKQDGQRPANSNKDKEKNKNNEGKNNNNKKNGNRNKESKSTVNKKNNESKNSTKDNSAQMNNSNKENRR